MQFGLSESQHILQDSAREFFAGECPMARVRRLMDTDTADDAALWSKLAGQEYTWENDLHVYYRRAKASETALGDATFHRERIARLVIDAGI